MARRTELLVGLDIGTACVTAVVASPQDGGFEVVGLGTAQAAGMRRGMIVSTDPAAGAVSRAIHEAEVMAGCEIHTVFAGVGGPHVHGCNSHGVVAVKGGEVTRNDVTRVLDAARAIALPQDQRIIHIAPQQFVLDGQDRIPDPVGMGGVRLEAHVHVLSAAGLLVENVEKCCKRAGLHVLATLLNPLASAEAVLGEEEKELGVVLIDLGAGTTDVLAFCRGAVQHTAVLPVGGYHVTNDLAAGLKTSYREAEVLKRRNGCARARDAKPEEQVEVPGAGGGTTRLVPRRMLGEIIEARMEEIFLMVQYQLGQGGLEGGLPCGVVLTGGGAQLQGCVGLAEQIFGVPVRLGKPLHVSGLPEASASPEFATAIGLVQLGMRTQAQEPGADENGKLGRVRHRMVGWLREFF